MSENITLVSKDGEHSIELPTEDAAEITNFRAQGWATAEERKAVADAEAAAPAEPDVDEDTPAVVDWSKKRKSELEDEVEKRNAGRADDARIVVAGEGHVPDLVAALQADDTAAGGGQ